MSCFPESYWSWSCSTSINILRVINALHTVQNHNRVFWVSYFLFLIADFSNATSACTASFIHSLMLLKAKAEKRLSLQWGISFKLQLIHLDPSALTQFDFSLTLLQFVTMRNELLRRPWAGQLSSCFSGFYNFATYSASLPSPFAFPQLHRSLAHFLRQVWRHAPKVIRGQSQKRMARWPKTDNGDANLYWKSTAFNVVLREACVF